MHFPALFNSTKTHTLHRDDAFSCSGTTNHNHLSKSHVQIVCEKGRAEKHSVPDSNEIQSEELASSPEINSRRRRGNWANVYCEPNRSSNGFTD